MKKLAIVSLFALVSATYMQAQTKDDDVLLFTYFRDNGQHGVNLASSTDGMNFIPLNDDKPVFTPPTWKGQNLTRDASVLYHDGVFHMVIKCSRNVNLKTMPGRNLWLTFTAGLDTDKPEFGPLIGPIAGNHSKMFSNPEPQKSMAEGQTLRRYKNQWLLGWDEPAGDGVQLATSPDLKEWTHQRAAKFPRKALHGTLFLAPKSAVAWLHNKQKTEK